MPADPRGVPSRRLGIAVIAATLSCGRMPSAAAAHGDSMFDPTREALDQRRRQIPAADALARARLLLETGAPRKAAELLPELASSGGEGERLSVRIQLANQNFALAKRRIELLDLDAAEDRALWYQWWFIVDDLAAVDEETCGRLERDPDSVVDRLAAGRLRAALLDPDGAETHYSRALELAADGEQTVRARVGLAAVAYERRDFDQSLAHLLAALEHAELDPDLLAAVNGTLIRLGRTDQAIDAVELAVEMAPYHERSHYLLGNGYARKNYTQLYAAYPDNFADRDGATALATADRLLERGDADGARKGYRAVAAAHPSWADVLVRIGSLEFAHGHHRTARDRFEDALGLCPEYGRAHNGIAKALEAERLSVEVHRQRYEAEFAARKMPAVSKIDQLVTNWHSLSPRHKKQVALSVAPWQRYVPVLIEGGLTFVIKPLYMILSETPGQETLHDLRISYDSRLWDDVRGCGGYHTVTGIEDVERTVVGRYNTVLHELTHQVHGVFPTATVRRIQELYRLTKERDQRTGDAFLSRYAGGSVWEYFAEGANSWESPRRDDYDTREIVRERLEAMDPALRELVVELFDQADVASCYPVAYVGRGDQALEHARPAEAIESYQKALALDPTEPAAIAALVYALQLDGRAGDAVEWAERGRSAHPRNGDLATALARASWHGGRDLDAVVESLAEARESVREEDRYRVDSELGRLHWVAGDADAAVAAFARVLDYQSDNPSGLWGRAEALALAKRWSEAWKSYDEAVRMRTGVVQLRVDYARDLIRAGMLAEAREQIEAAVLLDPGEPRVRALDAWWHLEVGEIERASDISAAVLAEFPWCTTARLVAAKATLEGGGAATASDALLQPLRQRLASRAPPRYVFRKKWGRYEEVETHPAVERELLRSWFPVTK